MIYAVNKRTKEHRVTTRDLVLPWADWEFVEADADGWIEWDGDDNEECPLPEDCPVEVKRRGPDLKVMHRERAASLDWQDIGSDFTITAYRPILEANTRTPTPERGTDATTPRRPFLDSGRLRERFGPFDVSPPAWSGEGLPPVGVECEWKHRRASDHQWALCEVVGYHDEWVFVVDGSNSGMPSVKKIATWKFRPIRSAEDKAVEEMARVIASALGTASPEWWDASKAIYSAIRDGKIPRVALTGGE